MRVFKGILLTGTAVMALIACSSDKGPGAIGSADDIVIRNRGEKVAVPPPGAEPVKEVKIADAATAGDTTAPSASEIIAAEDTGAQKTVEETAAAAQEAQEKAIAAQAEGTAATAAPAAPAEQAPVSDAVAAAPADAAPAGMAWNQPRRIETTEDADKLVEEQMAQSAPPAAATAAASAPAPVPATPAPSAVTTADAAPKIPVTAPENYTQDPDAPYSPAAARAAAAAQTGTPSDAPATTAAAAPATPTAAAETAPMALARVDGPMPLDAAVLQSKDPAAIRALQKTLADAGYYKGALNGEMNSDTLNAYVKYQTAAQAASAPAQPAPAPAPAAPAPDAAPAQAEAPAQAPAAPTPVFDQATIEQAAPAEMPEQGMSAAPPGTVEAPPPQAASQRPLVSRRTPQPLPPVDPIHMREEAPPAAVPAPAVQQQPAPAAAAPAPLNAATLSMTDPAVITAVQKALSAKGLYTGTAHGTMDADTLNAVVRYQASNGLTPGMLNIETLKSLGVVAQ